MFAKTQVGNHNNKRKQENLQEIMSRAIHVAQWKMLWEQPPPPPLA